jgi:hypothetical protein
MMMTGRRVRRSDEGSLLHVDVLQGGTWRGTDPLGNRDSAVRALAAPLKRAVFRNMSFLFNIAVL